MRVTHSEETLLQLIMSLPQGIIIFNEFGEAMECNPAASEILGLTREELLGYQPVNPSWRLFGGNTPFTHARVFPVKEALESGESISNVVQGYYHPVRRRICWINSHAIPLKTGNDSQPRRLYASFEDITARRRAEELFDKAFMENPCAMSISDLWTGRYLEVNNTIISTLGHSREEMIGRTTEELHIYRNNEDRNLVVDTMKKYGRVANLELDFQTKDGQLKNGLFFAEMIEIAGERLLLSAVLDITEQRQAEAATKKAAEKYKVLFESANDAIFIMDGETIVECNEKTLEVFGTTRNIFIGKTPSDLSPPYQEDGTPTPVAARNRILNALDGRPQQFEWKNQRADGNCFDSEVTLNWTGEGRLVQAILRDITLRKRTQEMLAFNERRLQILLEIWQYQAQDINELLHYSLEKAMLLTTSSAGFIYQIDRAPEIPELLSWIVESSVGASSDELKDELNKRHLWDLVCARGEPVIINHRSDMYISDDMAHTASHNLFRLLMIPIWSEDQIISMIGVANKDSDYDRDDMQQLNLLVNGLWVILQRRSAEERSALLQQMLRDTFDHMPSFLCSVDGQGRITQWNRRAETDTGITRSKALGMNLAAALADWPGVWRVAEECLNGGRTEHLQMELQGPGDLHRHAEITAYPLATTRERGVVLRIDDITDKIKMQEILIQTEKMLSVGGIAAGMAHEINNPLGGILQGIQNIYRRIDPDMPRNLELAVECGIDIQDMREYMRRRQILRFIDGIRDSATRAADIVSNMLQYSRQTSHHKAYCDINHILDKVLNLAASDYDLDKRFDFRHINIIREYDSRLPQVYCNGTEIEQVVLNLVKNAAQAMAQEAVERQEAAITLRTCVHDSNAIIEIEDNGPGMSEEVAGKVFEPFFTTKPPGEGTGLGLSVSFFIIANNHGGEMSVKSQPGQGSVFTIKLPLDG